MMSTLNTRRRMLLGGKKEPVYIFKEGTGFITNPLPGVTLTRLCDPGAATYGRDKIELEPKEYDLSIENPQFSIYKGGFMFAKNPIDFSSDFPGYKKLFIEANTRLGSGYCGLTSDFAPSSGSGTWLQRKSVTQTRSVLEFNISGITGFISAYGSLIGYSIGSLYIYNVWLE